MLETMVKQLELTSPSEELMDILTEWVRDVPKPRVSNPPPQTFRRQIVWFNAIGFLVLHISAVYGLYIAVTQARILTSAWAILLTVVVGQGITMGAHRLFAHKTFKAKPMLRLALVISQTMAGQNCLYVWVRDHRQHHKYSDTDADPHNSRRGFFFSHMGWLMCRKHPDVIAKGKDIDLSDLDADPFVMFQKRYYKTLYIALSLGLPVLVPVWLWGETPFSSFMVAFLTRTIVSLNFTWLVNSYAHLYGTRPYSRDIAPVESALVSLASMGEGWHNYHHSFPWDYKAAELGQRYNLTTTLLEGAAKFGWAYDLRAPSPEMVLHRVLKRGDGTHPYSGTFVPKTDLETPEMNVLRRTGQ